MVWLLTSLRALHRDLEARVLQRTEALTREMAERQRLEEALRLNQPLATAYYLKEDLRQFWEQPDKPSARRFLCDWIARAEASGITVLQKFARILRLREFGLLAWYDHPISTGPLEGTNNKIKTLQRRAYGFRDQLWQTSRKYKYFVLALLGLILVNNGWIIFKLAEDFSWLKVTPIW